MATRGRGRPRLSLEEKAARGTVKHARERGYLATAELPAPPPVAKALVPARDYPGIAAQYSADVLSGRIVASKWVKLACERQERDIRRGATDKAWPFVWDDDEAIAACHFVESCPHVEGKWSSPLIVLEPFQVFLVTALFGWRYRADVSRRRFTVFYFEVARKSAKSTLAAALGLYHLLREGEPGASVICGASTGQQARVVFGIMQKMVRRSIWLKQQGLEALANAIVAPDGSARPVNSKASSLDGLNPSCIILDEAHAQDFGLHDVLKSAQGARTNPLMLCPTTAGYDLLSVGYALHLQLEKVLDRVFEADHLFGAIYAIDDDDDWRDQSIWIKASPMLGISPTLVYVQRYCADAVQAPGLEGEFRVKICNVWAASAKSWIAISTWDKCADPTLRIEDFLGQRCWMGGDLAQLDDLAALGYIFEAPTTWLDEALKRGTITAAERSKADILITFIRCYLPEGVVEARARTVPAYRQWCDDGLLVTTEGTMIDYDRIEADIRADCARFQVRKGVFDQFGSAQIVTRLVADGFPFAVEPKNAKTATGPARDFESRVRHRRLRHDGNALLRWAVSNAVVKRGVDDSLLPKKVSAESPNKIDPVDAILWAILGKLIGTLTKPKEYQLLVVGGGR